MKYQGLFYQKNNEKIFKTVVCCNPDWRFKGLAGLKFSFSILTSILASVDVLPVRLSFLSKDHGIRLNR